MWSIVIGAVLTALFEQSREDKAAEQERDALGLLRGEGPPGDLVDFLVPIWIWADGAGIWRVISTATLEDIENRTKRKVIPENWTEDRGRLRHFLDPSEWTDDELAMTTGGDQDIYVYIEGPHLHHQPSSMLMTVDPGNYDPGDVEVTSTHAHGTGLPLASKAASRLFAFAKHAGWNLDEIRELGGNTATVPDLVLEVLKVMRKYMKEGGEYPPLVKQLKDTLTFDWTSIRMVNWAKAYERLVDDLREYNGMAEDQDYWSCAGMDKEALERIKDEDEEVWKRIVNDPPTENEEPDWDVGRESWGEEAFNQYVQRRAADINEDMSSDLRGVKKAAKEEADAASSIVKDQLSIDGNDRDNRRRYDSRVLLWTIRAPWAPSGDEPIEELCLDQNDAGVLRYELREGGDIEYGMLEALYRTDLLERESDRQLDEPVWVFPREYQGVWEIYASLGIYQPTGLEPMALFLKIADDHGLLSEAARKRYAKVLLFWDDPMARMREFGLTTPPE